MYKKQNYSFAMAKIIGGEKYPNIRGRAFFRQKLMGVLVTVEVYGLPRKNQNNTGMFALHIHNGTECGGKPNDPFSEAGTHFNPDEYMHPYHAGDLPPLFGNDGYAYMSVLTNRFTVREIMGRVIIIHEGTDDFTTQPAGNAGVKIACGKISQNQQY